MVAMMFDSKPARAKPAHAAPGSFADWKNIVKEFFSA